MRSEVNMVITVCPKIPVLIWRHMQSYVYMPAQPQINSVEQKLHVQFYLNLTTHIKHDIVFKGKQYIYFRCWCGFSLFAYISFPTLVFLLYVLTHLLAIDPKEISL